MLISSLAEENSLIWVVGCASLKTTAQTFTPSEDRRVMVHELKYNSDMQSIEIAHEICFSSLLQEFRRKELRFSSSK